MRLFSYIVSRDFGFAPNPFHGFCTLTACKPKVRKYAMVGDYVVGLTPKPDGNRICYVMEVEEKMSFDAYWNDPRFQVKKPVFNMSDKYKAGDNIYYRKPDGVWHQQKSHHTNEDGSPIQANIDADTGSTDQILIASNFSYWGVEAITLPERFGALRVLRAHRNDFDRKFVDDFILWFRNQEKGVLGQPEKWQHKRTFQ